MASQAKPIQGRGRPRGPGRPSLGSFRLETVLPQAAFDELKRREAATGIYFTRVATAILCTELLGGVTDPNSPAHHPVKL